MTSARSRALACGALSFALAATAWRFHRLRFYFEFIDETAEMTTGWLLQQGETLYGSVFSHHTPLAAALCQAIAALSPAAGPATFRLAPLAAYVLVALAVVFGPLGRPAPTAAAGSAAAFLLLVSLVGPSLGAHLVLNDALWGAAFAIFFLLLVLPLVLGCPVSAPDAAAAGVAAVAALAGSPVAIFPLVLSAAGLALAKGPACPFRRPALAFAAGAAAALGAGFLWLLRFGSVAGFVEEAFTFNAAVYSRFARIPASPVLLVKETLLDWLRWLRGFLPDLRAGDHDAALLPSCLVFLAILAVRAGETRARRAAAGLGIAALLAAVLLLRMRGPSFHALPLYLTAASAGPLLVATGGRRRLAAGIVLFLSYAPAAWTAARHESFRFASDDLRTLSPTVFDAAAYIRAHTAPTDRIAAFSMSALVYLEARRKPATDSVFYLPWQAAWEKERSRAPDTCAQLRAHPPPFVFLRAPVIWSRYRWEDYAACVDGFLKRGYAAVDVPELGGFLLQRLPSPRQPVPR